MIHTRNIVAASLLLLGSLAGHGQAAYAEKASPVAPDQEEDDSALRQQQSQQAEKLRRASATHVRRFHEVMDELLAEFGYDVKLGQIKGLKNLAIRQIRVSDAIPSTYEDYVEMLLTERIRENSQIRLINCVPCKTRTSELVEGKLLITSPQTNMAKLNAAASTLGIENFMDAVLVYHTTHMVLAVNVFSVETKELLWARTYNSETIKSRYQKLAIDYSQVEKSRPGEDYQPEYRFLFGLGGAGIPNVAGTADDSSMLNVQVRATEKFNNRKTEFGILLSLLKTTNSLLKEYPTEEATTDSTDDTATEETEVVVTEATPEPFTTAMGLYAVYGHTFLGAVESYNEIRQGIHVGAGGLLASGYLAPALRVGWDIHFGRRFTTSFAGNYIAASSILVDGEAVQTKGGAGADVILSLNY